MFRREYEPSMLNGDAHHSLVLDAEPRIVAVAELSKTGHILNDMALHRK